MKKSNDLRKTKIAEEDESRPLPATATASARHCGRAESLGGAAARKEHGACAIFHPRPRAKKAALSANPPSVRLSLARLARPCHFYDLTDSIQFNSTQLSWARVPSPDARVRRIAVRLICYAPVPLLFSVHAWTVLGVGHSGTRRTFYGQGSGARGDRCALISAQDGAPAPARRTVVSLAPLSAGGRFRRVRARGPTRDRRYRSTRWVCKVLGRNM
ncbi:unnamed protein product, partial [Iphiclides podalirius]